MTHLLAKRSTEAGAAQQQLSVGAGEQVLTLNRDCVAVLLSARVANVYVTFNDTVAAAGNGLEIQAGAQPFYAPLGYHANPSHTLRATGAGAGALLNVIEFGT